ncbi:MAG TPA: hypothetical protein PKH81_03605 [Treponemataceae bacterium]|nr:hypothetical protein [Treponemataceae bacterium]
MPSIPTTEHQAAQPLDAQTIATIPPSSVFFFLESNVMGPQTNLRLDLVVTIDPQQYWELPWKEKPTVARQIGAINSYAKENGLSALLVAPGRIGTTSPELGVPVRFAEIDGFCVVCERAWDQGGYRPELSFGSHFFQDLVESEIFYAGIPDYSSEVESGGVYNSAFFNNEINLYASIVPDSSLPPSLISVWKVQSLTFISDIVRGTCLCARFT